jgi:sulfotransferase
MSRPLAGLLVDAIESMSPKNEFVMFITNDQRSRILRAIAEAYYGQEQRTIIDTHRHWCGLMPLIGELFPKSRVIACVRSPAWILDSVERHVQANPMYPSAMFDHDIRKSVYVRAEQLTRTILGVPMAYLKQAWFGEYADRYLWSLMIG